MRAHYGTDDGEISAITLFIRLMPLWRGHSESVARRRRITAHQLRDQLFTSRRARLPPKIEPQGLPRSHRRALHSGPVCDGCDDWG
jgi:hypothetical protein